MLTNWKVVITVNRREDKEEKKMSHTDRMMKNRVNLFEGYFEDSSKTVERIEEGNKVDKEEIIDNETLFVKGQIESIQRVMSRQKVEKVEDKEDKTIETTLEMLETINEDEAEGKEIIRLMERVMESSLDSEIVTALLNKEQVEE